MSFRTVYGLSQSENGWPMVDEGSCNWITVPGTNPPVSLEIQQGWPTALLRAWAADWNAYVEPLRDADSACWTPTNSVASSNHLSGTAVDLDWSSHRFQVSYDGFSPAQIATVREMLAFYEDTIWWGQDWTSPKDSMHSQCGGDTYNNPATGDFIARKIRADGFSTFRRGNAPPPSAGLTAQNLSDAMGGAVSLDRYTQLLPGYRAACVEAGLSGNLNRLAMFAAQLGEESGGLKWMEEIASGSEYEGRSDLGNTQPGDGVRFKGRGPIQITGRNNYSQLSQWAFGKGYVPSPTFFVDNPTQLSTDQYGFLGPVWYWTVARPQINSLCDAGDIVGVTKAINGGTNGLQDRTNRWNHCLAMGLAELDVQGTTTDSGDDWMSDPTALQMLTELYDEYRKEKKGPSRSFMVPDGNPVDSPLGILWNLDGNVENINITWGYLFGTTLAEQFVNTVASTGVAPASWAGNVNQAWLQQYGQEWCLGLISFRTAIQKAFKATGAVQPTVVNNAVPQVVNATISPSDAQDIANRVSQQIAIPATPAAPAKTTVTYTDSGDDASNIADLYRSLKSLGLADALPIEGRAPLQALISILQTKNGTTI